MGQVESRCLNSPEEYVGIYTTGDSQEQPAVDLPLLTIYDFDDICGSEYNIARTQLKYWRMPTAKEFMELRDKCTEITWTTYQKIGGIQNYRTTATIYFCLLSVSKQTKYRKSRFHSILLDWFRSFNRRDLSNSKEDALLLRRFS